MDGIESFWVFNTNKEETTFKIFPDSCVDLIIDLHDYKVFLSGIMTGYQNRTLGMNANLIGIRMKAEWFPYISQIPVCEFKNQRVALSGLSNLLKSNMTVAQGKSNSLMDKINYLERLLLQEQDIEVV